MRIALAEPRTVYFYLYFMFGITNIIYIDLSLHQDHSDLLILFNTVTKLAWLTLVVCWKEKGLCHYSLHFLYKKIQFHFSFYSFVLIWN